MLLAIWADHQAIPKRNWGVQGDGGIVIFVLGVRAAFHEQVEE